MPDQLDYINDYFNGELPPEDKIQFEKRIMDDPEFAQAIAFYLSTNEAAQIEMTEERRKRFQQLPITNKQSDKPAIIRKLKPLLAAAVIILAFFISWNYFVSKPVTELASNYIKDSLSTISPTMSSRADSIQSGINLFNEGKLDEASKLFESMLSIDSSNTELLNLEGITLLRKGDYENSIKYFKKLKNTPGLYSNPGAFYHAIALLQRNGKNDMSEARKLLELVVSEDLYGKEIAQKWLRKW